MQRAVLETGTRRPSWEGAEGTVRTRSFARRAPSGEGGLDRSEGGRVCPGLWGAGQKEGVGHPPRSAHRKPDEVAPGRGAEGGLAFQTRRAPLGGWVWPPCEPLVGWRADVRHPPRLTLALRLSRK